MLTSRRLECLVQRITGYAAVTPNHLSATGTGKSVSAPQLKLFYLMHLAVSKNIRMCLQVFFGFAISIFCVTVSAQSTDSDSISKAEEPEEHLPSSTDVLSLGIKYFEEICLPSIGRPSELRRLAKAADLRPLSAAQFEKVKAPDGVEGWVRGNGQDYVIVEYSARKNVGCSIYMSRAAEKDIRDYVSRVAASLERKGSTVRLVHDELIMNRGSVPFRVLHYELVSDEDDISALGALISERPIRGRQGAFILLANQRPEEPRVGQSAEAHAVATPSQPVEESR